jgi:hypothetical protein
VAAAGGPIGTALLGGITASTQRAFSVLVAAQH